MVIFAQAGAELIQRIALFRARLSEYDHIDKTALRDNMAYFLKAIVPVAEEAGVRLAVHPDDPPRPILGLPRIVSTIEDMQWLKETVDSIHNGFTMCTGSYGVRADNDLVRMVETFADRIHFTHLRSTCREANPKTFHEAAHLYGDVDMVAVVKAILTEEQRRKKAGDLRPIPFRPDHGHQMLDDLRKKTNPGYSAIGRLKGLAEVRGVELALKKVLFPDLL
ncbi:mannonate dehydratase [Cronobacter sakazakii]|uniref:mannonate dehydratase n=1 Tax=Cronobacter sakazakii TaxID=28141 RepID=UPI001EFDB727|nr:mannonate dehydratase [Cronobacter sakazakii]